MKNILLIIVGGLLVVFLITKNRPSPPTSQYPPNISWGTVKSGPITWRGGGHEYARAMITYHNNTENTFSTVQIQCVGRDKNNEPISDYKKSYSIIIGDPPLRPGTKKISEGSFPNGSQVQSISCEVARATL